MKLQNDLFLKACKRQPTKRAPVWIMRQAGRYLPEYRAVRAKADFLTLCKTPELAAEVTIQPVVIVGVDAVIIFSDILVIPEAMGMELIVEEGKGGPRFPSPIRTSAEINNLSIPDPNVELKYVMDALTLTKKNLNGRVPLIGFSGAPWTLATYVVEGRGKQDFNIINGLINNLNYIEKIIANVKRKDESIIVFCKDCGHSLEDIAETGCDVVGLDWTIDIGEARNLIGNKVALQGNMDPKKLYESPEKIREKVKSILEKFGYGDGHVFNLGHGILPDIPVEHAKAFINAVKEESVIYHNS